jgi:hypothetical protein
MEVAGRSLAGGDYCLKGHVAGPGDKNLHGYDTYEDLLAASNRPAHIPSLTANRSKFAKNDAPVDSEERNTKTPKDTERMDTLRALDQIAQTRKLQPDENKTLLKVFEDGTDREKMTASWAIETAGSSEAVKELLAWENEYIQRQLGYDDQEDEVISPATTVPQGKTKPKRQSIKAARHRKKH